LEILLEYLSAFLHDMQRRPFRTMYVDGCSGTGYVERCDPRNRVQEGFFERPPNVLPGSARRALTLEPPFDRYVFIERNRTRYQQLRAVLDDFGWLSNRIRLRRWDANNYVPKLCEETDWNSWRAVIFLDPPGTQIKWETVRAIADTKGADLWYLFPLGQTVNRLLRRDRAEIEDSQRQALKGMFGCTSWYDEFYRAVVREGIISTERQTLKTGGSKEIGRYFVERLWTVFPYVIERPLRLYNRTGVLLFTFCFASPSKRRAEMARDILTRPRAAPGASDPSGTAAWKPRKQGRP
jgi:three-Cys-motif partner protein